MSYDLAYMLEHEKLLNRLKEMDRDGMLYSILQHGVLFKFNSIYSDEQWEKMTPDQKLDKWKRINGLDKEVIRTYIEDTWKKTIREWKEDFHIHPFFIENFLSIPTKNIQQMLNKIDIKNIVNLLKILNKNQKEINWNQMFINSLFFLNLLIVSDLEIKMNTQQIIMNTRDVILDDYPDLPKNIQVPNSLEEENKILSFQVIYLLKLLPLQKEVETYITLELDANHIIRDIIKLNPNISKFVNIVVKAKKKGSNTTQRLGLFKRDYRNWVKSDPLHVEQSIPTTVRLDLPNKEFYETQVCLDDKKYELNVDALLRTSLLRDAMFTLNITKEEFDQKNINYYLPNLLDSYVNIDDPHNLYIDFNKFDKDLKQMLDNPIDFKAWLKKYSIDIKIGETRASERYRLYNNTIKVLLKKEILDILNDETITWS